MSFFGRRRSQSDAAPPNVTNAGTPRPSLSHRYIHHSNLGFHRNESPDEGMFHGLFRRRSDSLPLPAITSEEHGYGHSSRIEASQVPRPQKSGDAHQHDTSGASSHGGRIPESPTSCDQGEPKQPGNIQDFLEYRLSFADRPQAGNTESSARPDHQLLTKNDVKAILSGAPHFLLEKGKHGRWYPQVVFPWDEHNPSIQHLWDRKPLPHASFTLGVPIRLHDWRRTGGPKRATFDIGVFEVPNMLSNNGQEPGTVGFRHFLELAVADLVRYNGPPEPSPPPSLRRISSLPATEAFELMEHYNDPYSQCRSGAVFDRHRLICDGPQAWKRIGVRNINLRSLAKRLNHLRQIRHDMLRDGSTETILDIESPQELHQILYTHFLHPPPRAIEMKSGHPQSLKFQIKTLTLVLSTPGAWVDFSLPEWRFRAGQVLWEPPPHEDGDCIDPRMCADGSSRESWVHPGMERKWLLIQLLLAAELLLRLDAFVRVGMLHDPHGVQITVQELRNFDKLLDGKVNWDLIVVRRFLDSLDITCASSQSESPSDGSRPPDKPHRFSLLETFTRRGSSASQADLRSAWDCNLSSSHVRQQLEGLYVFAKHIAWPRIDALQAIMQSKLGSRENPILPRVRTGDSPIPDKSPKDISAMRLAKEEMYTRQPSRRHLKLRNPRSETDDQHEVEDLGWISRSWLSGFVIPGENISHLLMATLLENDPDAIKQLGPTINLYGGFVYRGQSWWSKACIVGRVLSSSERAKTCMGWINSDIVPRDATTLEPMQNGWFEVPVDEVLGSSSKARIKQGGRLAMESTPLGMGDITAEAFTLPKDVAKTTATVYLKALHMSVTGYRTPNSQNIMVADKASMSFSVSSAGLASPSMISLPLKYNVRFISAHECRPPLGSPCYQNPSSSPKKDQSTTSRLYHCKRLPGHPLHRSFPCQNVPLAALANMSAPPGVSGSTIPSARRGAESLPSPEVWVIDARGDRTKETFARAWCASVGCHAIIGRSGRTCVACCIREARAVDVRVVVRVGD
ncbi:hypothetical protein N7510_005287 [Penicillium lagena]|uniref:uncharacterized protein n=1 Tax=Penicillium lagena TaxID=94218 RepID=UPI00254080EF|nr:uncharacterized protein N7510_005287 [Penicillium lagena]KAJ5612093.1 hypothetical protein N7510_005287 [Penicillium lagena]